MRITTNVTTDARLNVHNRCQAIATVRESRTLAGVRHVAVTPYELLAVPAATEKAVLRRIGHYRTYDEALRARDEDVLDELSARGGWYTLIEHVNVEPGLQGPRTAHLHATALGVNPAAGKVPSPHDLDDARQWLAAIRES
jgi:hypothetical protein